MTYSEILEYARDRNSYYTTMDFNPSQFVKVVDIETSSIEFRSAFFEIKDEWLLVFAEHQQVFVKHRDEVIYVSQLVEVKGATGNAGWGKTEGDWHTWENKLS